MTNLVDQILPRRVKSSEYMDIGGEIKLTAKETRDWQYAPKEYKVWLQGRATTKARILAHKIQKDVRIVTNKGHFLSVVSPYQSIR